MKLHRPTPKNPRKTLLNSPAKSSRKIPAFLIKHAAKFTLLLGLSVSLTIIILWFPRELWQFPIQADDAPAHYYFIAKLLDTNGAALFSLAPNGAFYPPLFHFLAFLLIKSLAIFGLNLSLLASFNLVWIFASGLIFPAGIALLTHHFLKNFSRKLRLLALFLAPIFAVSFASHPFQMLLAGPLVAFAFAMSLLPLTLFAILRFLDQFSNGKFAKNTSTVSSKVEGSHSDSIKNSREQSLESPTRIAKNPTKISRKISQNPTITSLQKLQKFSQIFTRKITKIFANFREFLHRKIQQLSRIDLKKLSYATLFSILLIFAELFSQPRIFFSLLILLAPFLFFRLSRKLKFFAFGAILFFALAFIAVAAKYYGAKLLNPAAWFHSHAPTKNFFDALIFALSGGNSSRFFAILIFFFVFLILILTLKNLRHSRRNLKKSKPKTLSRLRETLTTFCEKIHLKNRQNSPPNLPAFSRNISSAHDQLALIIALILAIILYVSTVTFTGGFANLITAPWYRDENRLAAMLPIVLIPIFFIGIFTLREIFLNLISREPPAIKNSRTKSPKNREKNLPAIAKRCPKQSSLSNSQSIRSIKFLAKSSPNFSRNLINFFAIFLLIFPAIFFQVSSQNRTQISLEISRNSNPATSTRLTREKWSALEDIAQLTPENSLIFADPLTGANYIFLFSRAAFFPTINPEYSGQGAVFPRFLDAFATGHPATLAKVACAISPDRKKYFLDFGPQFPSAFPFRAQFDVLHDQTKIANFTRENLFQKVAEFPSDQSRNFILYKINCSIFTNQIYRE